MPMAASADGEVNIYSYRQAYLLKPLLNAFEKETGIQSNVVFAKQGLAERLERDGLAARVGAREDERRRRCR